LEELSALPGPGSVAQDAYPHLGREGAEVVAHAAEFTKHGIEVFVILRGIPRNSGWAFTHRLAGRAAIAADIASDVFTVWQWHTGSITGRQFYTNVAYSGGRYLGGWAGGWIGVKTGAATGAMVGIIFGPEAPPVGAAIGGMVGGLV